MRIEMELLPDEAIDRTTSLPAGDGTTPDIGAAVSALWWREDRRGVLQGGG